MSDAAAAEPVEEETIEIAHLKQDIAAAQKKILSVTKGNHVEAKHLATYLRDELLPVLDSVIGKVGQQEEALFDLFEQSQMVSPQSATIILSAMQAAANLAAYVEQVLPGDAKALELVNTYRAVGQVAEKLVEDLVGDDDAEGDDEEEAAQ